MTSTPASVLKGASHRAEVASPGPTRTTSPSAPDDAEPPARPASDALRPWREPHPGASWLATLVLALTAAVMRFWALDFPPSKIFDEVYYATEAQELRQFGYEDNRGYMFIVHPPLGKWLIALTSTVWGNNSLGWRVAPAIAGVVGVVLVARISIRMLRSTVFGLIGGVLMCCEGMSFVLARTALLDIFLQTFVVAGFGALVIDRDRMRARLAELITSGADLSEGVPTLGPRPWRLFGGVLLAAACSVKWTALSFFVGLVLLSLFWDRAAFRSAGVRRPWRAMLRRSALPGLGSLVAAPVGTYLLGNLGWFLGENSWNRHWAASHGPSTRLDLLGLRVPFSWVWVPAPIRSLGAYILQAYRFHEGLHSGHTYQSNPWSWLVLGRPVDFYYKGTSFPTKLHGHWVNAAGTVSPCGANSCSREVLLLGTPLMWWAIVPMLLWLAWHWFTTRDWRAGAIWLAFAAGWLVWFQDLKRTMFLFYMAPLMPFLVIGLTLALGTLTGPGLPVRPSAQAVRRRKWGLAAVSVYLAVVVADFVWMWPIFTGGLLTYGEWHARMWLPSWV